LGIDRTSTDRIAARLGQDGGRAVEKEPYDAESSVGCRARAWRVTRLCRYPPDLGRHGRNGGGLACHLRRAWFLGAESRVAVGTGPRSLDSTVGRCPGAELLGDLGARRGVRGSVLRDGDPRVAVAGSALRTRDTMVIDDTDGHVIHYVTTAPGLTVF